MEIQRTDSQPQVFAVFSRITKMEMCRFGSELFNSRGKIVATVTQSSSEFCVSRDNVILEVSSIDSIQSNIHPGDSNEKRVREEALEDSEEKIDDEIGNDYDDDSVEIEDAASVNSWIRIQDEIWDE